MIDWEDWQQALAARYLAPEPADQPLILFIDPQELESIGGPHGRVRLVASVKRELSDTGSPYSRIWERARAWEVVSETPPPTLPLLAVTVLAATAMESADGISVLDYYTRLRNELVPDGGPQQRAQWRNRLQHHFPEVADAWLKLHRWITIRGRRSTIIENPHPSHIGYPLSQALIRRADQNGLTQFWRDAGLEPGADQPAGFELLKALRAWVKPSRGFSSAFVRTVDKLSGKEQRLFEELLHRAACGWDGVVRNRGGSAVPKCRLTAWQARHAARLEWLIGAADTPESLEHRSFSQDHLTSGLEDEDGTPLHGEAQVVVMRFDQALQRWIEVPDFRLNQEHTLVWDSAGWSEAAEQFVLSSDNGSAAMIRPVEGASGTRAIFGIYFSGRAKLENALKHAALRGLHFEYQTKPRLRVVGGLRISTSLGTRAYVSGGAPDVVLPSGNPGEMIEVALDTQKAKLPRCGLSFPLLPFQLKAESHRLESDGSVLHFEIASEPERVLGRLQQPPVGYAIADNAIALTGSVQYDGGQVRGGVLMRDADEPSASRRDLFAIAKRGMTATYLIGPRGHVRQVEEHPQPSIWTEFADCPQAVTFNVPLHSCEVWMVQMKQTRVEVCNVGRLRGEPGHGLPGTPNPSLWDEVVAMVNAANPPPDWHEFVKAEAAS